MVMGHTPHRKIQSNCDGSVLVIDTGISKAYGGILSALESGRIISHKRRAADAADRSSVSSATRAT